MSETKSKIEKDFSHATEIKSKQIIVIDVRQKFINKVILWAAAAQSLQKA